MEHVIVTDLGFGDAGKGTVVDYLVRHRANPLVVRHNGGCQAAHNVVTPDGKHHTFSQFGSGTFVPDVETFLSEYTILNPANMIGEEEHLVSLGVDDAFDRLYVAESALVITPYHRDANRIRERLRGDERHGSCGQGIGETVGDSLRFGQMAVRIRDLKDPKVLKEKFAFWREVKRTELGVDSGPWDEAIELLVDLGKRLNIVSDDWLEDKFDSRSVIFEGAQGVLLDEDYGFAPHNTWSKTTDQNARKLLGGREAFSLGVCRTYMTRHGAGPFVSEYKGDLGLELFPEPHNGTGEFQGVFRVGAIDFVALRYALGRCYRIDGLAVTHVDRMHEVMNFVNTYVVESMLYSQLPHSFLHPTRMREEAQPDFQTTLREELVTKIETALNRKVVLESHGPTHLDKYEVAALVH